VGTNRRENSGAKLGLRAEFANCLEKADMIGGGMSGVVAFYGKRCSPKFSMKWERQRGTFVFWALSGRILPVLVRFL
jgi:hypothetical protein